MIVRRLWALFFRLALLVAIGMSTALLLDYLRPLPAFCDVGSGCDQIRGSAYGQILGIPLPALGLLSFVMLMVISLTDRPYTQRAIRILATVGGVTGALLLLTQALVLHTFCKLCVVVDVAGIAAAMFVWVAPLRSLVVQRARTRFLFAVAMVVSLLLPAGWSWFQPSPPVPREIASLWVPGKINVVEFADFECPFCRQLHPSMLEVLNQYAGRVNFVRLNMPLSRHPQSRPAARAYCCADAQGKAFEMADALFQSDDLSPEACERLAQKLGLSIAEYRTCVASPKTDARIDEDIARVHAAGLAGLPTVWIGDELIVGLVSIDRLQEAFATAAQHGPTARLPTLVLWGAFALALVGFAALVLFSHTDGDEASST